jgi:DNA-binding GntR family transcriptional regulator
MTRPPAGNGADRVGAIYQALRRAIIEQALEPGAKLPEDAIGERFGVGRTLMRHALGRLAGEGLVELRRNHGAAVAKPNWDAARDIFAVRLGLERLVVATLAGQLGADAVADLRRHWQRGGRAWQQRAAVD